MGSSDEIFLEHTWEWELQYFILNMSSLVWQFGGDWKEGLTSAARWNQQTQWRKLKEK